MMTIANWCINEWWSCLVASTECKLRDCPWLCKVTKFQWFWGSRAIVEIWKTLSLFLYLLRCCNRSKSSCRLGWTISSGESSSHQLPKCKCFCGKSGMHANNYNTQSFDTWPPISWLTIIWELLWRYGRAYHCFYTYSGAATEARAAAIWDGLSAVEKAVHIDSQNANAFVVRPLEQQK